MLEAGVFEYYLHGFCMDVEIPQTRIMHCKNTNMCLKEKWKYILKTFALDCFYYYLITCIVRY